MNYQAVLIFQLLELLHFRDRIVIIKQLIINSPKKFVEIIDYIQYTTIINKN